ncbi:MAG: hypothetical protein K2H87_03800, partial [Duncaniella sp.]|nr:hypothetical protein [Duncaniella sp.]
MKKLLFLLAVLLTTALASSAQTAQVATLSHEGTISTFYSANALKDAYAAAVDGDVITLSSGTFSAPSEIKKNITLRGAGMMPDANPTILTGDIAVRGEYLDTSSMTLEGLYHNGILTLAHSKDAKIVKCKLKYLKVEGYENQPCNINLTIIQCLIDGFDTNGYQSTVTFINDEIQVWGNFNRMANASFTNCVLIGNDVYHSKNYFLKNCIIVHINGYTGHSFSDSSTLSNCYYIGSATNPFENSPSTTNHVFNDLTQEDIFKDLVTYELKDEYAGSWLGDDGTQVGAHGGMLPFDPTPTNPQI